MYKQFSTHETINTNELSAEIWNNIYSYLLVTYYGTHVYTQKCIKECKDNKPEKFETETYHLNGQFLQCCTYDNKRLKICDIFTGDNILSYYNFALKRNNYMEGLHRYAK